MKCIVFFILLLRSFFGLSQSLSSQLPGAAVVWLDLENGIVKDEASVPYQSRILFKGEVKDPHIAKLYAFTATKACPAERQGKDPLTDDFEPIGEWTRPYKTFAGSSNIALFISSITPSQFYKANTNNCLVIREEGDKSIVDPAEQYIPIRTSAKFDDYVKLDFGVGYSPRPNAIVGSTTVHFYALPTNNFVNFKEKFSVSRQIFMRTSFFIGIAPVTLYSNTKQDIKPFTSVGNLVFGIGMRAPQYWPTSGDDKGLVKKKDYRKEFAQGLRINLGGMVFKQADPSPFIKKDHRQVHFYTALTYDASLSSLLAPIALLFGLK